MGKNIVIIVLMLSVVSISWIIGRPMSHSPDGKKKIIMFGQSTMGMWFKHWNWPYPLRIKTTYKPWPIPFKKYSKGDVYLEYHEIESPKRELAANGFGSHALDSVKDGLGKKDYDAAFFKFCFVDFRVKKGEKHNKRFKDMKKMVSEVYEMISEKDMELIVGNALPLPKPNEQTLMLMKKYNDWLIDFASRKENVLIYDMFGPLTLEDGRFDMKLAHAPDDHHPGEKAFQLLDKSYFPLAGQVDNK